jgi:hypothetical protein
LSTSESIDESPWFDGWPGGVSLAAAAAVRCAGSRLAAPTIAEPARTLRRVGGDNAAGMIVLPGGKASLTAGAASLATMSLKAWMMLFEDVG